MCEANDIFCGWWRAFFENENWESVGCGEVWEPVGGGEALALVRCGIAVLLGASQRQLLVYLKLFISYNFQ